MNHRLLSIALLLSLALSPSAAGQDRSWTLADPLSADPQALLDAAAANPADLQYPSRSLHFSERVELDKKGRAVHTWHHIYQVYKRKDGLGTQPMYWRPAFDRRPRLRARVIHPDGTVYNLDPRTGVETTHGTQDQLLYVDTRSITAPLPMLVDGAVVEEVFELRSEEPWKGGGHLFEFTSLGFEKGAHVRFDVVLPEGMTLHEDGGRGEFVRTETTSRGRRHIAWERTISSPPSWDMVRSEELRAQVRVRVSTAPSWAALAQTARGKIDPPPASPELAALAAQTVAGLEDRTARIEALTRLVHDRVRYVAVELGMGAIEPRPAPLTLAQGYGDCKDKATLLITLLRAVGIEASAVLLQAGEGEDLGEGLPAVFAFNHVILVVHGEQPLYIDATDPYSAIGDIPITDQGRKALVLAEGTQGLIELPKSTAEINRARFEEVVRGGLEGPAEVFNRFMGRGLHGAVARRVVDTEEDPEQEITLDEGPDGPGGWVTVSQAPDDRATPTFLVDGLHLEVDCLDSYAGSQLSMLRRATPIDGKVKIVPEHVENIWRVEGPASFAFDEQPEPLSLDLGRVRLWREGRRADDGALEVVCGWELQGDLSPEEAEAFKTAYKTWSEEHEEPLKVFIGEEAVALAHAGRAKEGLAQLAARPQDLQTRLLRAASFRRLGLLDAERRELEALAPEDPASLALWWRLFEVRIADEDGAEDGPSVDRAGAIAALRRVRELAPDLRPARDELLDLLAYNAQGRMQAGELTEARALLEQTLSPRDPNAVHDDEAGLRTFYLTLLLVDRQLDTLLSTPHLDPEDPEHQAMRLAALTLRDGATAGLDELRRLRGQGRAGREDGAGMAVQAAELLRNRREYGLAEAWVKEASALGAPVWMISGAGLDHPIHRWEDVSGLLSPEESLALRGGLTTWRPDLAGELLRPGELHPAAELADMRWFDLDRAPDRWELDRLASNLKVAAVDTVGNATRARLETTWPDADPDEPPDTHLVFLVRTDGVLQVRALEGRPSELGRAVLERLDAGDLVSAQALLDWAQELPEVRKHAELRLWGMTGERGAATARAFGTVLLAWRPNPPYPQMQAELERALKLKPLRDPDAVNAELAEVLYRQGKVTEALVLTRALRTRRPDDKDLAQLHMAGLTALRKTRDLQAAYDDYLKRWGEDDHALNSQVELHVMGGKLADALALAEAADQRKAPDAASLLNNASWGALYVAEPDWERAVKAARRSKELEDGNSVRHTLACLLLETGELTEAVELLEEARGARGPLGTEWWVVVGRAAQLSGLPDEARAAYAKIPASDKLGGTRALADRFLAELGG